MPYMHMLSDPGMNYTLNRPLLDGTSPARIKEIGAVPDCNCCHPIPLRSRIQDKTCPFNPNSALLRELDVGLQRK
jgi:hypothetical protein